MSKNPFDQQSPIPGVRHIVAVGSGKGGVGKSTLSANLALALKEQGLKVGLLDADIYGPSQPRLWGTLHQKPETDAQRRILPIERLGVKLMSIGYLVDEDLAVVWRGPMLFKAMNQFLGEVLWGDLDVLLVDLPPGTGDVQLSLVQKVPVSGAVLVSTPQNLSLSDMKKAVDMFKRTGVPVLGAVENMSYLDMPGTPPTELFAKGDLHGYLAEQNIELLGEVPFHPPLGVSSEMGLPFFSQSEGGATAAAFRQVATKLREQLGLGAAAENQTTISE